MAVIKNKAKVGEYVKIIKKLPYEDQMGVVVGDIGVVNYVASTGKYSVHIEGKKNPKDKNATSRAYGKLYDFWIPFECCKVVDYEELTKKCLFENADALDTYIGTIDNMVCLSTISNDVSTWSVGTYKGNDCVMPSYARLKESEEKKMKEIKNQKVVDLYFKRRTEDIEKKYFENRKAIYDSDKNQIFIAELKKQYNEYCETNKEEFKANPKFDVAFPFTKESELRIAESDNQCEEEIKHLNELKEEILAMLSGCETYEQELVVLKNYYIVTDDNRLIPA